MTMKGLQHQITNCFFDTLIEVLCKSDHSTIRGIVEELWERCDDKEALRFNVNRMATMLSFHVERS